MAMSRATGGRWSSRRSGSSPTEWGVLGWSTVVVAAGSRTAIDLVPNARVADLTEPTLVRVRGFMGASSSGPGALVMGIIALDNTHPVASYPSPLGDGDADWLYWGGIAWGAALNVAGSAGTAEGSTFGTIDSKAKRKLNENDKVVVVVDSLTGGFTFTALFRFLLMQTARRR